MKAIEAKKRGRGRVFALESHKSEFKSQLTGCKSPPGVTVK
jgi:hypothetical protein